MKNRSKIQNPKSKIAIVGAGPAGASLAIRLAQKGFGVTLIEREKFPRHKLCGEFISPECLEHFGALGVLTEMTSQGGDRIAETVFYSEDGKSVGVPSEWFGGDANGALGLSRAEMDFRLLERARESGVEVFEETQVVGILDEIDPGGRNRVSEPDGRVGGVKVRDKRGELREISSDLTIDATGRARVLGKLVEKEISRNRSKIQNPKSKIQNPLVGFKTHLKNVNIKKGVCEIYFFRGGYGGLSFVEKNTANHCFLIRAEVVREFGGDAGRILENVIFQNQRAREMMRRAEPQFDWLAVAVDGFGRKDLAPAPRLLSVGDAAAFIDPFTGSGMLMALESAEILAESISAGNLETGEIARIYEDLHRRRFQKRLRICRVMRRASFTPQFAKVLINVLSWSTKTREILARATRKTAKKTR